MMAPPAASAAAEPPDEPPGVNSVFHGQRVVPFRRVWVIQAAQNSEQVPRARVRARASSCARRRLLFCAHIGPCVERNFQSFEQIDNYLGVVTEYALP